MLTKIRANSIRINFDRPTSEVKLPLTKVTDAWANGSMILYFCLTSLDLVTESSALGIIIFALICTLCSNHVRSVNMCLLDHPFLSVAPAVIRGYLASQTRSVVVQLIDSIREFSYQPNNRLIRFCQQKQCAEVLLIVACAYITVAGCTE